MVPYVARVRWSYVNGSFKHKLNSLYGEGPPEKGFFVRLQEYQRGKDFIAGDKRSTQS